MQQVPKLIFGDSKHSTVDQAKKMGLGEEWVYGDPMAQELNAIVSPANTVGEMSGGYDLVIRNRLGRQVEQKAMASLADSPMYLGQARVVATQANIPWLIIVPTVVGRLAGQGSGMSPHVTSYRGLEVELGASFHEFDHDRGTAIFSCNHEGRPADL